MNGRIYEWVQARREGRPTRQLLHTALELHLPEGRYVIENAWPSPDADVVSRGVTAEGPVFSPGLARLRMFRYEVRCWRDGSIADASEAIDGLHSISDDHDQARRLLQLTASVPTVTWGRRPAQAHEMWNSNSVISWLLVRGGIPIDQIHPPAGAGAPGWEAGIDVAHSGGRASRAR
ncbi:MAG: hypothetical protein WAL25_12930 [Acidimicrobiia bacterium]